MSKSKSRVRLRELGRASRTTRGVFDPSEIENLTRPLLRDAA